MRAEQHFMRALECLNASPLTLNEQAYERAVVHNALAYVWMHSDRESQAIDIVQESIQQLESILKLHPNAQRFLSVALDNLGALMLRQHRPLIALQLCSSAVALCDQFYRYHHNVARAMKQMGLSHQAIAPLERAKRLDPAHEGVRLDLIDCYEEDQDFERARDEIGELLDGFGDDADLRIRLVLCLIEEEAFDEALRQLSELVRHVLGPQQRAIVERMLVSMAS